MESALIASTSILSESESGTNTSKPASSSTTLDLMPISSIDSAFVSPTGSIVESSAPKSASKELPAPKSASEEPSSKSLKSISEDSSLASELLKIVS